MKNKKIIAIALSGGIDSLAAAYLLKQKYKNVFGIHFYTGYEKAGHEKAKSELSLIQAQLGLPITYIDLSSIFEKKVVSCFIKTYLKGKTPNPCIICNKEIKFGALMSHALDLGADYFATGHYAEVVNKMSSSNDFTSKNFKGRAYLKKAKDRFKDQSYFLSLLSSFQLERIIFPLSGMTKNEVRAMAQSCGISPVNKKESQDICFIHDKTISQFILDKQNIEAKQGNIINMEGKIIGRHNGLHQFTVGQRRGINVPAEEPYYVKKLNMKENILEVCFKKDLATKSFHVENIHWNADIPENLIQDTKNTGSLTIPDIITKIRYNHQGAGSDLIMKNGAGEVHFHEAQNAVTPGQTAVFYESDRVLGAGFITNFSSD